MTTREFFHAIRTCTEIARVEAAIHQFEAAFEGQVRWVPVGRENNRGTIEVSSDPARSLVERVTNGIDAVLEAEYERHRGRPDCRSPKEAASAWLNVPVGGLSEMTQLQRRQLAQRVSISLLPGEGPGSRTVVVRDGGIGLTPEQMPRTILSLNETNKITKHYLAGAYGQGGSSTFAACKYTFIASRYGNHPTVGFTVVRFHDLPAEEYKIGHYVYLTLNGAVLQLDLPIEDFPSGTEIRHYGYDLTHYKSPLGPTSVYGLLNRILFDPVMPIWLDSSVHNYRRVIKGSRNALNGAVDEGDDSRRGPNLSHRVPMFYVALGEFGRIGIEYWVLDRSETNMRPTAAFVDPAKPIILTLHGQNHEEMSQVLVRKDADLPYLRYRLICHVDCDSLTPTAKRVLFVSNREGARRGVIYELVQQEIIKALRSDDDLARLNREAYELSLQEQDENAAQRVRSEVARILRVQGVTVDEPIGGDVSGNESAPDRPTHPRRAHTPLAPIELHEPPSFIRILWDEDEAITFYPEQRRYIRIETDASSNYHDPNKPAASRINIVLFGDGVRLSGSTPLQNGRMRVILEGLPSAKVGAVGAIRVELTPPGHPTLSDERPFRIIETPPIRTGSHRVTLPPFDVRAVKGPEDERWQMLGWPDNPNIIASSVEMEAGKLVVWYSTVYPKFANLHASLQRRDPALAASFTERYKIWLAVHSLLMFQDEQVAGAVTTSAGQRPFNDRDEEAAEERDREERCRIATLAALFAAREVREYLGNEAASA